MKFSIISPIYNASSTIKRCYDSIVNQSYQEWEWICVDDGSRDDSLNRLKKLAEADQRVEVISQSNAGPSAARNAGLREAKGEYVLFVDADDYLCDNFALDKLAQQISAHPDCDLIYFQGNVLLENGEQYHDKYSYRIYKQGIECLEDHCNRRKCIVFGAIYAQCYRMELLRENGIIFDNDICYGEDRLFTCQCFVNARKTIVMPETFYTYVVMNGSLMHDDSRKVRALEDNKRLVYALDKICHEDKRVTKMFRKYIHNIYMNVLHTIGRGEIDYSLLFRNASTWKLLVKDCCYLLGLMNY